MIGLAKNLRLLCHVMTVTTVMAATAGCTNPPAVTAGSPVSVVVRAPAGNMGVLYDQAGSWCRQHGRDARLVRYEQVENFTALDDWIGAFDCQ